MADDTIEISIELDDGTVKQGFARIQQASSSASKKMGDDFDKGFVTRARGALNKLNPAVLGAAAAAAGAFAAFRIGSAAVEAARVQEDAVNKLNQSLRSAGTFSAEASASMQAFAAELEATTTVGDETAISMLALSRNFTDSNEEAIKLTKAAVDLSAQTGVSLDSAVTNLGKSFSGLSGELGESVKEIRNLTQEELKAGGALDLVLDRFGGAGVSEVNTFSGAIKQLQNTFGTLLEEIGKMITGSPILISVFKEVSVLLGEAQKKLSEFGQGEDFVGELVKKTIAFALTINDFLIRPSEVFFNGFMQGLRVIGFLLAKTVQIVATVGKGIFDNLHKPVIDFLTSGVGELVGFFDEDLGNSIASVGTKMTTAFSEGLDSVGVKATEIADELGASVLENANGVFDSVVANNIETILTRLGIAAEKVKDIMKTVGSSVGGFTKGASKNVADLASAYNSNLVKGITKGTQQLVANIQNGQNAFAGFGDLVLGVMADMATSMGQTLLLAGVGIESLKTLGGAAAIAAGIGLIALGAILSSMSGGGTSAATAGGGGGAGAIVGEADEDVNELTETEVNKPKTEVNINVQGNILDRRESGLELVSIINDAFDNEGVVIAT